MFDIFLETMGSAIAAVIFITLLRGTRQPDVRNQPGSQLVVVGFGLLLFSLLIDITDNFPALDALIVVGDTETQAFLEKVVGMLLGLCVLALGFIRWMPAIQELARTRRSLDQLTEELDLRVHERTVELEKTNVRLIHEMVEREKVEKQLKHQALHDSLTNLSNRHAMMGFLKQLLNRSAEQPGLNAVLFLDLDNFKAINDLLGHETGDRMLQVVSERLNWCRRQGDFLGRLGGDEFVLVLTDLNEEQAQAAKTVEAVIQQINHLLAEPIRLADHTLKVSASAGVRFFPVAEGESTGDLLRQADIALYHSKNRGMGLFSFFDDQMRITVEKRLKLASELDQALAREQFVLHYQPQMSQDGQLFGLEALVRWQHPIRGMIEPNEFVTIAEEAGLIDKLGRYVLRRALSEYTAFCDELELTQPIKLAVNISPSHFLQPDFINQIETILSAFPSDRFYLVLEVTEGVVIQSMDDISDTMEALRKLGIGVSLDDFGTGYSSLAYIQRLPFDTLKIDQSFVADILNDANNTAIVDAILSMASSLGVTVIAEGVETEQQCHFLEQRGCTLYQGFWFARPAPLEQLLERGIFNTVKPEICTSETEETVV